MYTCNTTYNVQRALPYNHSDHSDHSAAHMNEFRVLFLFFVFFFSSFACGSESPQLAIDQNNCGLFGNEVFALILIVIADGYFVNNTTAQLFITDYYYYDCWGNE